MSTVKPATASDHQPRSNRANPRQRAQRAETRERLIEGAIRVFAAKGYANSVIEDVLSEAGVSRASFYAHFPGKAALVTAIADGYAPVWQPLFHELAAMRSPDFARLRDWCARDLALYRQNQDICIILTQAAAVEPELYWQQAAYQEALTDLLATGNPALAHLREDKAARLRAALSLSQIDHTCYFLAIRRWQEDPAPGIDAMAAQLLHFLTMEARPPKPD